MASEFLLATFIMAVGLAVAGAATHFYQMLSKEEAMLRFDGRTFLGTIGHLVLSFVCGPYIMLQMGWRQDQGGGTVSMGMALLSAFVAFGWSFITGLIFVGSYVSVSA